MVADASARHHRRPGGRGQDPAGDRRGQSDSGERRPVARPADAIADGAQIEQLVAEVVGAADSARGALAERLADFDCAGGPRQLRTPRGRRGRVRRRPARRSPAQCVCSPRARCRSVSTARWCTSCDPLTIDDAVALFTASAGGPADRAVAASDLVAIVCRQLDGSAAGDRAGRGAHAVAVGARDRPAARRPVRAAERPDRAAATAPRRRCATPSRGATTCCSPTTSVGCGRCRASPSGAPLDGGRARLVALDVPAVAGRSTSSPGSSIARWSIAGLDADGNDRYRLLDSIRAYATSRLADGADALVAGRAHAEWIADLADRAATDDPRRRPVVVRADGPSRAGEHRRRPGVVGRSRSTARVAHRRRVRWHVDRDRRRRRRCRAAARRVAPLGGGATAARCAVLQAGWLEASAGDLGVAAADLRRARSTDRRARRRRARPPSSTGTAPSCTSSRAGPRRDASPPSAASNSPSSTVCRGRPPGQPTCSPTPALALGDPAGASRAAHQSLALREASGDSWGRMHADAMLGRIAALEGRPDEAEVRLRRAATSSAQLGFAGQTGLHLANLGDSNSSRASTCSHSTRSGMHPPRRRPPATTGSWPRSACARRAAHMRSDATTRPSPRWRPTSPGTTWPVEARTARRAPLCSIGRDTEHEVGASLPTS